MKVKIISLICLAAAGFCSCIGVSMDISINNNGSGSISLEYRVSEILESIGRLDGNENRPAIPAGKTDFERSVARIPGLRLVSYSSKYVPVKGSASGGRDLVTKVVLDFSNTDALISFLSSSRASLVKENNKNILRLALKDTAAAAGNKDLKTLVKDVSGGYEINISLRTPRNADLTVIPPVIPPAIIVSGGKKVSFNISLADLLEKEEGLILEIKW